jgi:hypothetical protein
MRETMRLPSRVRRWLRGRVRREAIQREIEREGMTPDERRITGEPVEDLAADRFVEQRSGGKIDVDD